MHWWYGTNAVNIPFESKSQIYTFVQTKNYSCLRSIESNTFDVINVNQYLYTSGFSDCGYFGHEKTENSNYLWLYKPFTFENIQDSE